ncbi:MAG: hypothetical protein KIT73_00325 [Burkholderiales bacterium]|nr:hypothetical protein [Burkholderiales bacterium]
MDFRSLIPSSGLRRSSASRAADASTGALDSLRAFGSLRHLGWLAQRELPRLGWRGGVGIVLVLAALGTWFGVLRPMERETAELREQVADLRMRLKAGGGDIKTVGSPRGDSLETFYAFFPTIETLPDWVGQLHTAAARNGLTLESGEYQLVVPKDARLMRYQITLPIRASYPQLRGFVAEVLDKIPAAGVEDVAIRRENIASPVLDVRLKLTVWLGGG